MSWPNDKVLEFLELYKCEEILWNPKHPSHKSRPEVNQAWERIQLNLGINCSVTILKRKKESLMVTYRLIKKKSKISSFRKTWFAYSIMDSFLGGKYEPDRSEWKKTTEFIDAESFENFSTDDQTFDSKPLILVHEGNYSSKNQLCSSTTKSNRKRRSRKIKQEDEEEDEESQSNFFQEVEECDLYCQLLAKKLKKLDENQRDMAMHEIDNIMFRAKMKNTNNIQSPN